MQLNHPISKRYIGIYKGKPYCFGKKKECKLYMEIHRLLKKDEYELEEYDTSNEEHNTILLEQPELLLRMDHDVILTERDHKWISEDSKESYYLKQETLQNLYQLIKLFHYNKGKYDYAINSLMDTYKTIYEIDEEEIITLIEKEFFYHPLVSIRIDEYICLIKTYLERDFQKERYLEKIELE